MYKERNADFCNQLVCRWKMFRNNVWLQPRAETSFYLIWPAAQACAVETKPIIGSQQVLLRMLEIRRVIAWCVKCNIGSVTQNLSREQVLKHNTVCLYWIMHGVISDAKNNIKGNNDCIAICTLENVQQRKQSQRNLKLKVFLCILLFYFSNWTRNSV